MKRTYFEIKKDAKSIVKAGLFNIMLTTLAYILIQQFMNTLVSGLSGYTAFMEQNYNLIVSGKALPSFRWPRVETMSIVLSAAVFFMTFVLEAGYVRYVLLLSRGERVSIRTIFESFAHFGKIVAIQFLTSLLIGIGFVFFIIPGVMLAYRYRLALFILYDNPGLGPVQCMRHSAQLMSGNKMRRFMLDLSFIGWIIISSIISSLIMPLLELWLSPYMGVAGAVFYNDLIGVRSGVTEEKPTSDDDSMNE